MCDIRNLQTRKIGAHKVDFYDVTQTENPGVRLPDNLSHCPPNRTLRMTNKNGANPNIAESTSLATVLSPFVLGLIYRYHLKHISNSNL